MLPAERGEMSQQAIRNILDLAKGDHGALEVSGVPKDDRGDEQVEAGCAMLLVLVGAVADFAEAMDEHRAGQAIAGFAFVEFLSGCAAQLGVVDPVEREQRVNQR